MITTVLSPIRRRVPCKERQGLTRRCARSVQDYLLIHIIRGFAPFVLPVQFVKLCQIFGNSSATLDRMNRIYMIIFLSCISFTLNS